MKKIVILTLLLSIFSISSVKIYAQEPLSKRDAREIEREIKRDSIYEAKEAERASYIEQLESERELRASLSSNSPITDSLAVEELTDREYRKILSVKFNKNRGYKNFQAFEDQRKYALLEKGVSYASFNLSFEGSDIDNLWFEPIAIIDYAYYRNVGANISGGYFVRNNLALGAKFSYSFTDVRLTVDADLLEILIGADSYETNNASTVFSGSFLVKNYVPLDRAQRLFIVSETNIGYANTHSLAKNYYGGDTEIHKVETQKNSFFVGLSPGFMYFMSKGFAFEFSLSPVVAYYTKTSKINNEVPDGSMSSYGLSFKFNPLNIQFGFSYFFGLDYIKNQKYVSSLTNTVY